MDLFPFLTSGALWAALGVVVTQGLNYLASSKKTVADQASSAYTAVNEAQKQVVDSLFQQVKLLTDQLSDMRAELQQCKEHHNRSEKALLDLQAEISVLGLTIQGD